MKNKTSRITFNLKDRGRVHTGQDRSNVDVRSWIDLINSPATQELIQTGDMLGYVGHELRQMYGMTPPDTIVDEKTGRTLKIFPAVRTIHLSADQNGNVTHQEEFLDTPEGEYAKQQYIAKIGGFSAATSFRQQMGAVIPTSMHGFDYVKHPNYATNVGDGLLLDSAMFDSAEGALAKDAMLNSLFIMYDGIYDFNAMSQINQQNMDIAAQHEQRVQQLLAQKQHQKDLIAARLDEQFDSALCPTTDLDAYLKEANQFLFDNVVVQVDPEDEKTKKAPYRGFGGLFGG